MKYNEDIVEEICRYVRDGSNQKDAYIKAGISETQFYEWKRKYPTFAEALKKAADECRAEMPPRLECSLFKRALGYDVEETETEYGTGKDGAPYIKSKKIKKKHIQPDTTALIFALANMLPDKWKNRQQIDAKADIRADVNESRDYRINELPKDKLFELADMLQDAEKKREHDENEKNAGKETEG